MSDQEAHTGEQGVPGAPLGSGGADDATEASEEALGGTVEPDPVVPGVSDGTDPDDIPDDDLGAPTLSAGLEALLLVTDVPMEVAALAAVVRRPVDEVLLALQTLASDYRSAGRGMDLRDVAGGWRLYTSADCAALVTRYVRDGQQARLTQAALETLAVVAYRQPVSRGRISAVRGVNVDGVIRTLSTRGLIDEAGHDESTGAILYRTTDTFLERLGLRSLEELPAVADYLPDIEMLDDFIEQTSS